MLQLGPLHTAKSKETRRQHVSPIENHTSQEKDMLAIDSTRNTSMVNHSFKKSNKLQLS